MTLIQCKSGETETHIGGALYVFKRDQHGRAVCNVHKEAHVECLLSVVDHYIRAEPIEAPVKVPQEPVDLKLPPGGAVEPAREQGPGAFVVAPNGLAPVQQQPLPEQPPQQDQSPEDPLPVSSEPQPHNPETDNPLSLTPPPNPNVEDAPVGEADYKEAGLYYSRDELEEIGEGEGGLKRLREIVGVREIKSNSVTGLIDKMVEAGIEKPKAEGA